MTQSIRVFLVDDHAMVRAGLAALVAEHSDIAVVGQCGEGLGVINGIRESKPDVVVLDITLPGLNGLDLCRELKRKFENLEILILTMHDEELYITQALQNGATGYLLKDAAAERLVEAIRRVASGEIYLGPGIPKRVLQNLGDNVDDPYETLSTRERQVLQLIAESKTNRQISEILDLAVKTVDTHRTRLMRKLNIHDQTSLVKYAIRRGLITV